MHGLDHLVPQLHAKSLEGDWQGMAELISDETLDHFAVTASWKTHSIATYWGSGPIGPAA